MPVQLFSRIRTVRFRKKKPKPPKPPTKPLRRLKSKIKKACNSMADRFRSRRPNPPPGNTNSNNNVVSTTGRVAPIQGNVTPGRASLSSQKSPVRATAPVDAVVRIQESGGVSKMLQQPPSTSVLPSKPKVPSGTLKQSGSSSSAANSQKNTGVSQTARSNAVRSSSPRPSRRRSTDSLAMKDHLTGSPSTARRERSNSPVVSHGRPSNRGSTDSFAMKDHMNGSPSTARRERSHSLVAGHGQPSNRGSTDSFATKDHVNGSPSTARRERSHSLVAGHGQPSNRGSTDSFSTKDHMKGSPSTARRQRSNSLVDVRGSSTSTSKEDPQSGKITRERSASLSRPRMSGPQPQVLLPKRKFPPPYVLPSVCTQLGGSLKDLTAQKMTAPKEEKTGMLSSVKTVPRSPSRERRRKEKEEKQRTSGNETMVKPMTLSSTPRPSSPSQNRSVKDNSTGSQAAGGSVKTGDLRRNSDVSSCGSGRPSPTLPRKEGSGMQDSLNWSAGSIGSAVRATTVDAKTTPIWTSVSVLSLMSWSQSSEDMTLNSQSVYSVAQPSSGRQNSGGGRRQSSNVFVTTAAWIYNHLQPSCYTTAGMTPSSPLTVWGAKGGNVGITNLGNTCYMNCMLQCLGHTPEMTEMLLKRGRTGGLTKHYADLMKQMWFSSTSRFSHALYPRDLKLSIANFHPDFYGNRQHDAQELLRFLLAGLQNEWLLAEGRNMRHLPWNDTKKMDMMFSVKEKGEYAWNQVMYIEDTPLAQLFMGQLLSSLWCTYCGHTSMTFDPVWDLALPFPAETTNESVVNLIDCFETFNKTEVLDGNNKAFCSGCHRLQRCHKSFTLHRPPRILVIHLKRFSGLTSRRKLEAAVEIPFHLNITRFLTDEIMRELKQKNRNCCYDLYAMANHNGSESWGHYTATYKHHTTHQWYTASDDKVFTGPSYSSYTTIQSKQAYVLFYKRATC